MLSSKKKTNILAILAILLSCLVTGWQISAWSLEPIPERFATGRETYLEYCATCHIAIPPEVMPTDTWRKILEKPQNHYGTSVNLVSLTQILIWNYMRSYSRPLNQDEQIPQHLDQSRYFKALHPAVPMPEPLTLKTCIACHPSANSFDFRTLSKQWESGS